MKNLKNNSIKTILTIIITGFFSFNNYAQVGIGTNSPNSSAILEVNSNSKGFLPPRMTHQQKMAIPSPEAGLFLWCSNCGTNGEMQVYNGTDWTNTNGSPGLPEKPGSPTNVVARGGTQSATISFTAPSGTTNITSYTVTASPGGLTATGTSSPIVVTGLSHASYYTFTVVATNVVAISEPSAASSAVITNCGAFTTTGEFLAFMCYNLGVTTTVDPLTYQNGNNNGDYYQWGRNTDGHEKSNSSTTNTLATNNLATLPVQVIGKFIINSGNWCTSAALTLQTTNWGDGTANANPAKGSNDPCPAGYKIPSRIQLISIFNGNNSMTGTVAASAATANTWTWTGNGFKIGNNLFFPGAGDRHNQTGNIGNVGNISLWTSTLNGNSVYRFFGNGSGPNFTSTVNKPNGYSVRCVVE